MAQWIEQFRPKEEVVRSTRTRVTIFCCGTFSYLQKKGGRGGLHEVGLDNDCDLRAFGRSQDDCVDAVKVQSRMLTVVRHGTFDERIPHAQFPLGK